MSFADRMKKGSEKEEEAVENDPKLSPTSKETKDVTACVIDYGTFICLAEKLAETYKKVYYYTPTSQEFYSIDDLVKAAGLENVERVEDIFDPKFIEEIDLFIFPDIGYGGLQRHFRDMGKAVWGSMGADEIENIRTEFISLLKKLGLPVIHTETIEGLTELREYLEGVENKWIKVNQYRGNMETWHHIDIEHSAQELDRMAIEFGGLKDTVTFLVQDFIPTSVEIGYDGWCIDGVFPNQCFQGYEKKDELYVGQVRDYEDMPEQIHRINEGMAPTLKKYGYRNFFATEIRVKDGVPYFIDPTLRMPGVTGEQLTETCANLAEVVWKGAQGVIVQPQFTHEFAVAAIMHSKTEGDGWKILDLPKKVRQWTKLLHFCKSDNMYHFPPRFNDELGTLIGVGDTISAAVESLVEHYEELDGEPLHCAIDSMSEFVNSIADSEYGLDMPKSELTKVEELTEGI